MMGSDKQASNFFQGLFIAIGLTFAGYFISQTIYNSKVAVNTAASKGLAERRVTSDLANWTIRFTVSGQMETEIPSLYKRAEKDQMTIVNILKELGLTDDEINIEPINYRKNVFRNHSQQVIDVEHRLNGSVFIETKQINIIALARKKVNSLIIKGIKIEDTQPSYYYTKLNTIKPDMLKEATKNARIAASEFAKNADVKVGSIQKAWQGSFIIKDVGEEYSDNRKIEKSVRVVTHITFYLTE